jgi:hypothetical protein
MENLRMQIRYINNGSSINYSLEEATQREEYKYRLAVQEERQLSKLLLAVKVYLIK